MIGIIGAMDSEVNKILDEMKQYEIINIGKLTFYKSKLNSKDVVLVKSGIGMVASALTTSILINEFKVNRIYFSGVAGSLNAKLKIGDIVIAKDLIEYRFDTTSDGRPMGVFPDLENSIFSSKLLLKEAKEKLKDNNIYFERIVSGDKFVENKVEKEEIGIEFDAYAVDMESAALAHVCTIMGVDFLVIRSISDSLSDDSTIEFNEFVHMAAENSKNILLKLI